CRRYGLQDADTLDVGQDVLRSVFCHLGQFRNDRPGDSFRKWLKTITRNRILDIARRAGRTPPARGGSDVFDMPDSAEDEIDADTAELESERQLILRRGLEMVRTDFEPRTWDAFWRATVDEVPAAEVALALGVSVNVVYLSKSRVLRRLTDLFTDL